MKDYQTHPDPSCYGIETRDGESVDDYIAKARGFNSVNAWREFRDSSPQWRTRTRDNNDADSDEDTDRRRQLELMKIKKDHQ